MNYSEAISYLYSLGNEILTAKLGLENISVLLEFLGNPHRQFNSILIAGTNGKGSVAAFCESVLRAGGYRTGLYTSPHLEGIEERAQVNGQNISQKDFSRLASQVREAVQLLLRTDHSVPNPGLDRHPTFFEMVTAIAFLYFAEQGIDIGILEVGMGGRFDATNVVDPLVAVITNVDYDHQKYLGDRLEKIAWEKAGIIKSRAGIQKSLETSRGLHDATPLPVVYAGENPEVDAVVAAQCEMTGARLQRLGESLDFTSEVNSHGRYCVRLNRHDSPALVVALPLPGSHQVTNAMTAVCVLDLLGHCGFPVRDDQLCEGIEETRWPGRLEIFEGPPRLLLDGAHNIAGAGVVRKYLRESLNPGSTVMIFGSMRDKDYRVMGELLFPLARHVVLTGIDNQRAADPAEIAASLPEFQSSYTAVPNSEMALQLARQLASKDETIVVVGSLFLVGEIRRQVVGNRG